MLFPWEWRENDRLRRDASHTLATVAHETGVVRFIQESFAPIYEDRGDEWIDEHYLQRPAPYNRTVLDAERSANHFTDAGGTGVVLRFAGFYGADAFLRDMLATVKRGWAPLPGPANAYWSSISHEDAATAVVAALSLPSGAYNVCDDEPLTRREFADAAAAAAHVKPPKLLPAWLTTLGGKSVELLSRSQRMTNAKLKSAVGWSPQWPSARDGLRLAATALRSAQ